MSLQSIIFWISLFQIESLIAVCYLGRPQKKKKTVECRSREQRRAFSEFSFELALTLSLQWFCKNTISGFSLFQLKVVKLHLQSQRKSKLLNIAVEIKEDYAKYHFWSNFFRIESSYTWMFYLTKARKKKCWMSQHGIEKSIFIVCFLVCVCLIRYVLSSLCT